MRKKAARSFLSLILAAAMVVIGLPSAVYAAGTSAKESDEVIETAEGEDIIDIAPYAAVSTDYVSSWENLNGINNEAFEPGASNQGNNQGWGNWPQDPGSSHYVQYDWTTPITTDSFQVYWYDDGGGTRVPSAIQFQYKDASGNWQDLAMKSNLDDVIKTDQYNTISVDSVTTKSIRFNVTVRDDAAANGIYRWKVQFALTDETADTVLELAKEQLVLNDRMASDTLLPAQLSNGVTVAWTENHDAVNIEGGKAVVTRGDTDVTGTLRAELSLKGKSVTKDFTVTVPQKTDAIPDMLAKYDFSNLSGTLASGSTIADVSGHDHNAVVQGSGVSAAGNVLTLSGGNGYVQLPTGMFDNQNNLTISMWIQNDIGPAWTSAFFFGKNTTSYFMINPQNPSTNAAKMCITWGGSGSEIGIAPGTNLSDGPYTGSEWTHYTAVITENSITGYINGEKYNSYALNRKVSDMGTGLLSYIGKSEYAGDPIFRGKIRNVSIYSKAVSDAEAGQLYTEGLTEEQILQNAADALTIPEVKDDALSTGIYDSVTLQKAMLSGLVTISWESGSEEIISTDGKVTAPKENTNVKLTAEIKVGDKTQEKEFNILVLSKDSTTYAMTLDKEDKGVDISQELFGLFYEDINSSADGGLSPELVKNNSFQNYADGSAPTSPATRGDQTSWKKYWTSSNSSGFTVEQTGGLNENNTNYAKLTGNQTLSNVGFTKMWDNTTPSIPVEQGMKYDFSMWMKADAAYAGTVTVQVTDSAGQALTDVQTLELKKDGKWNKISAALTGSKTQTGKLTLTISGAAAADVLCVDMVSLASQDTYGYGNKNYAYGAGLRKDLVEALADLKPSFIRFPGGCAIEGDYGEDSFYNWENSIGPLEERKAQASYWGDSTIGKNPDPEYGYMMSFELGYHEIMTLCEDLGAEAFPIMSAGIYCQFAGNAPAAKSGEELDPYAQYAIDFLNYCWGDPDSSNAEEAKWAKKRVENGHAEPFELHYIGIGNENWNTNTVNYYENFTYIKNKIEAYKEAHYPDHQLQLIFAYGPYYWNASNGEDAYSYVKRTMTGEVLVDEHYYAGAGWMLENTHRYDSYDRLDEDGTNVFVGEYAVNDKGNTLEGAIAEAAYMTGFERNGDIVRHASYAPLLAKIGATNWSPNMIYFDEYDVMKTPNYYVQWMYANNYGKTIVNTALSRINGSGSYQALNGGQTDIYQVSSVDENYIYLKLINSADYPKDITLTYPGVEAGEAEIICLTGDAKAENVIGNETVVPVTTKEKLTDGKLQYLVPATSFSVIKVAYNGSVTPEVKLESITVKAPTKTEYTAGEELDLAGMKVVAKYSDDTEKEVTEGYEVSGYDKDKTGEQTVTVTYEGKTATFKVTVKEAAKPDTTDKTALEAAVKAAIADTEKAKYTEESWAAYEEALNQAKEVLADADATQKEIDDAATALDEAAKALESKGLPYEDVAETDWFYDEVAYNYYEGTMTGTDTTHFSPYATLVRAQFATILHRMEGKPDAEYTNRFSDVPDKQFYSTAVLWAADAKIVTGYTDSGYFGTNDPITREQMVVMMYRYADYKKYDISKTADLSGFSDAGQVSGFAETAMKWAVENGIIEGKKNTDGSYRLDPQGSTSRAECAIIIQRFMEIFDK